MITRQWATRTAANEREINIGTLFRFTECIPEISSTSLLKKTPPLPRRLQFLIGSPNWIANSILLLAHTHTQTHYQMIKQWGSQELSDRQVWLTQQFTYATDCQRGACTSESTGPSFFISYLTTEHFWSRNARVYFWSRNAHVCFLSRNAHVCWWGACSSPSAGRSMLQHS